jgi:hypothetical protein
MKKSKIVSQIWQAPWYEKDTGRLIIEKEAMGDRFPGFTMVNMDDKSLAWRGTVKPIDTLYEILVIYPDNFPDSAPLVYPINPVVEVVDKGGHRLRHQYLDGHLCLYYPGDRSFHRNTTAAVVVAVASAWFFAYECWLASGKEDWPGPEAN